MGGDKFKYVPIMNNTKIDIIKRFKNIHNNLDYSEFKYINSKTKGKVFCTKEGHGYFYITPNNHLQGRRGCPVCVTKTTKEFVKESIDKHGLEFEYEKTIYKHSKTKLIITCLKEGHGDFEVTPHQHLIQGTKCPKCNTLNTQEFIKKSKEIHGEDTNSYFNTIYKNIRTKVNLFCNKDDHGEYYQTPQIHLNRKSKCPKCNLDLRKENPTGWSHTNWQKAAERSKNFDSYKVYVLKCIDLSSEEHFFKIGKTYTTLQKRFVGKSRLPYQYSVLKIYYFNSAKKCSEFEKALKNKHQESKYTPLKLFNGMHECFSKLTK